MFGLDTNILIRLFMKDDAKQTAIAQKWVTENCTPDTPGFINIIVFLELEWVLRSIYRLNDEALADFFSILCNTPHFAVQDCELALAAITDYRNGYDLTDSLIGKINSRVGCERTLTFDRAATSLPDFKKLH